MSQSQCTSCGRPFERDAVTSHLAAGAANLCSRCAGEANQRLSGLAVAAVLCAAGGFCVPGLGVLGIIFGSVGMHRIEQSGGRLLGGGMARAGQLGGALSLVFLVVAMPIYFAAIESRGGGSRLMQNSSQTRGIHQGMNIFAQGNSSYFPGLDSQGNVLSPEQIESRYQIVATGDGTDPAMRLAIMLAGDYFEADYIVNPAESRDEWTPGNALTPDHYSYALLALDAGDDDRLLPNTRGDEWRDTVNSLAVVISDRNVTGDTDKDGQEQNAQSIWITQPGDWRGSVCWNDGHVSQETTSVMENTQYGKATALEDDNLFQAGPADATLTDIDGKAVKAHIDAKLIHGKAPRRDNRAPLPGG